MLFELLFIAIGEMPGLAACKRPQELTIMHARPRGCRRSCSCCAARCGGSRSRTTRSSASSTSTGWRSSTRSSSRRTASPPLTASATSPACSGSWLSNNQIATTDDLPCDRLGELRELWLQANPLEAVGAITGLRNLQVLSLAGTRVRSLEQLAPLVGLPCLFDLALEDAFYGAAPVVDEPSYHASALRSLKQLGVLDGKQIAERQRSDAEEEFLQRCRADGWRLPSLRRPHRELRPAIRLRARACRGRGSEQRACGRCFDGAHARLLAAVPRLSLGGGGKYRGRGGGRRRRRRFVGRNACARSAGLVQSFSAPRRLVVALWCAAQLLDVARRLVGSSGPRGTALRQRRRLDSIEEHSTRASSPSSTEWAHGLASSLTNERSVPVDTSKVKVARAGHSSDDRAHDEKTGGAGLAPPSAAAEGEQGRGWQEAAGAAADVAAAGGRRGGSEEEAELTCLGAAAEPRRCATAAERAEQGSPPAEPKEAWGDDDGGKG